MHKTNTRLAALCTLAAVVLVTNVGQAAPIVTAPTLDTANDLMDIGGGTVFATDSLGATGASGGGPWAVSESAKLSDNDVETTADSKFNNLTAPVYVGVHSMPTAVALGGFAITTYDDTFPWWMAKSFTIQGSNDSTNGYGGTWTDIFVVNDGDLTGTDYQNDNRLKENTTYRWNAADNTFLSSDAFTSFRLEQSVENISYAEIEFFAVAAVAAVPEPSTIVLGALGFVGLIGTRRRRRNRG